MKNIEKELKYLKILSKQYPSISKASTEIINLEAILNLPKGTEHFISDIHGEYEAFVHVLKNGSGVIKRKIEELFSSTIRESEKKTLATLVFNKDESIDVLIKKLKELKCLDSKRTLEEQRGVFICDDPECSCQLTKGC